jgi:hypothetical protein
MPTLLFNGRITGRGRPPMMHALVSGMFPLGETDCNVAEA